jgi:hypothetical protein
MKNRFGVTVVTGVLSVLLSACAGVRPDSPAVKDDSPSCPGSPSCKPAKAVAAAQPEALKTPESQSASPVPRVTVQELPQNRAADPVVAWRAETTSAPAGRLLITGLALEQNGLEIVAGERITSYRVLTLTQPSRLVIEIDNCVSGFAQKSVKINRLGIATVNFENSSGGLRVILEGGSRMQLIPYRIQETTKGLKVIITNQ